MSNRTVVVSCRIFGEPLECHFTEKQYHDVLRACAKRQFTLSQFVTRALQEATKADLGEAIRVSITDAKVVGHRTHNRGGQRTEA